MAINFKDAHFPKVLLVKREHPNSAKPAGNMLNMGPAIKMQSWTLNWDAVY
jgi:hypothetical protein